MKKLTGTYYTINDEPEHAIISVTRLIGKPYPQALNKIGTKEYWEELSTTYIVEEVSKYSFVVQVFENI